MRSWTLGHASRRADGSRELNLWANHRGRCFATKVCARRLSMTAPHSGSQLRRGGRLPLEAPIAGGTDLRCRIGMGCGAYTENMADNTPLVARDVTGGAAAS